MQIKPIKNHIVFQFLDAVDSKGQFVRTTKSGIILGSHYDDSAKSARWANVIAVGPQVCEELRVEGCQILVAPLKWTSFFLFNDQKHWRTDENEVLMYRYPEDIEDEHYSGIYAD